MVKQMGRKAGEELVAMALGDGATVEKSFLGTQWDFIQDGDSAFWVQWGEDSALIVPASGNFYVGA